MKESYPYMVSNNKIGSILTQIKVAQKPAVFTHELLKKLGFTSSNDRAIIPLLKRLGFLTDDGTPTEYYDRLKDSIDHPFVLGERIKDLYSDLYAINNELHTANDEEIKGAMARVTGKDTTTVSRYFSTFKTLINLAKFGTSPLLSKKIEPSKPQALNKQSAIKEATVLNAAQQIVGFHHNIEIHLPATTDVSVYNAIFGSIKENLLN